MIGYAAAGDLLTAYGESWRAFDGDAWVALFTEDAEYHGDPFGAPMVGHIALRASLLDSAAAQRDVEFTIERHWVSGTTVLAAWHASWIGRTDGRRTRTAGFLTVEIASDGRIGRFRQWAQIAPGSVG
jgi:ketosteroid isomerase-like protein